MSEILSITENSGDLFINDDTYKRFFKNSEFHQCLQEYLLNNYSIEIKINFEEQLKKTRLNTKKSTHHIRIVIINETNLDKQQILFNFLKDYFNKMYTKFENDSSNISYFHWIQKDIESLNFLHKLINKKFDDLFTLISITSNGTFSVHSLPKISNNKINIEKLEDFLYHDIVQEIVSLPLSYERSIQLEIELKALLTEQNIDDEIIIKKIYSSKQKEFVIFGLEKNVQKFKRNLLQLIERNILHTYKLNPTNEFIINDILPDYYDKIKQLEENYKQFGVNIRLRFNEFSSPQYLKDEIESSIQQLLSQSTSTIKNTFESPILYREIAKHEEKHLKSIVEKYRCYITTELQHTSTVHFIPKSSIIDNQMSDSFSFSSEIFKKMSVRNGSIELRIGDIALQQVEALVIPRTFNGLKEGLVERAGTFDYEKTEIQSDGTMFTETDGGKLSCKRILFSNWMPSSLIKNEDILKSSIRLFMKKSIELMNNTTSIAFAVSDSTSDETILAREMFFEAKQQLENDSSQLRIVFVLLPEQKNLYNLFSNLIENVENVSAYFDWPMTVIKLTLIGIDIYRMNRCEEILKKYFSRCITSVKITNSNGIFQFWNQHLINSFYKYCKDRFTLPKLNETQTEIEFIGAITIVQEVKKKFEILSKLVNEKLKYSSIIKRPNSARIETNQSIKLYNLVLSYSRRDIRKCQRLVNRLTEEGFSIGVNLHEKRDIRSQMTKSDCIILCISEHYYENSACIEEAKYAFETNKKVFLVTFQNTCSLSWNDDLFEGKLFFQLFGSQYHFDLEYERLLIELLQYTKPGFYSLLQRKASFIQENTESPVIQSQKTFDSTILSRQLPFNEEHWLYKIQNISRQKSTLYSARSSFISEKPVSVELSCYYQQTLDTDILKPISFYGSHLLLMKKSIRQTYENNEQIYGISVEKSPQIFPIDQSSEEFIPRRKDQTNYRFQCLGNADECTTEQMKYRQKFENVEKRKHAREQIANYFLQNYKCYTRDQLDEYLKFAQRMKNNTEEFQKFCLT